MDRGALGPLSVARGRAAATDSRVEKNPVELKGKKYKRKSREEKKRTGAYY